MLKKKLLITSLATLLVSPIAMTGLNNNIAYATNSIQNEEVSISEGQVIYYTNQQLFDSLEAKGYSLSDIYTEEELEQAKAEDMSRAGVTKAVSTGKYTWDLYLSSAYTKALVLGGDAAGIILSLLGFGTAGGVVSLGVLPLNLLDTSKGIYLNLKNINIQGGSPSITITGWGYQ